MLNLALDDWLMKFKGMRTTEAINALVTESVEISKRQVSEDFIMIDKKLGEGSSAAVYEV